MLNFTEGNEKAIMRGIFILSGVIFIAIVVLGILPQAANIPPFVKYLPKLNALINATCSVLLITSLYHIRKAHRKIAKWSFPIWLYVTVTGVIVYLMISPYYQF
ncbi:MAG: DUF420 domain-containing protein [Bacteroidetes bacterium]|nr:DUF420 domain-containing protein [Bacteroidota bacterium]